MGVHAALLIVLIGGLVLSNSRGGLGAFLAGLTTFALLSRRRAALSVMIVVVLAALLLALPGGDAFLTRFGSLLDSGEVARTTLYELAVNAISLRPWTGWGLGSFEGVYSLLQPPTEPAFYERAHNTYLELMLELGIPFGLTLPLIALWLTGRCAMGFRERARSHEFAALAVSATVLVGVHSLVDFSLQIPAVAILYAAILGIGWAQSWSTRREHGAPAGLSQPAGLAKKVAESEP
jgi:O-antigen ligase